MASAPGWLRVQSVAEEQLARIGEAHLHPGEREAIALAELLTADYLVIDEKAGRLAARRRNIAVVGTLGVLDKADSLGVIEDFPSALARLRDTNFHISLELGEFMLRRHRNRRER